MRFTEVARRLTGFSTPLFGLSWDPGQAEVASARAVLVYLEDRRVLFAPWNVEVPEDCIRSVIDIRTFLTDQLIQLHDRDADVAPHLRAMRAACRKFLTDMADLTDAGDDLRPWQGGTPSWVFTDSLGQLRATIGMHVAQLSAKFGIDLEDELASIIPAPDIEPQDDRDDLSRRWRRWR